MLLLTREQEKFAEGRDEGKAEGLQEANERVAVDMLKKNFSLSLIEEISTLSENAIRNLATALGISIA